MLTGHKKLKTRVPGIVAHPVKGGANIYDGAMVVLDGTNFLTKATAAANLRTVGVARKGADNTSGQDGALIVEVRHDEAVKFLNDSVSPVTRAHIGLHCYIKDDQTVTSDNTGTSVAGTVYDIDPSGVWVRF